MQVLVKSSIEQQIDNSLFPRRNVERSTLPIEIVFQAQCRAEAELLTLQVAMDCVQAAQPVTRQFIKSFSISGNIQSFSPLE